MELFARTPGWVPSLWRRQGTIPEGSTGSPSEARWCHQPAANSMITGEQAAARGMGMSLRRAGMAHVNSTRQGPAGKSEPSETDRDSARAGKRRGTEERQRHKNERERAWQCVAVRARVCVCVRVRARAWGSWGFDPQWQSDWPSWHTPRASRPARHGRRKGTSPSSGCSPH